MSMKIVEALSVNERIEARIHAAEKLGKDWANIEAILGRPEGSYILNERFYGANIVTDDGDEAYAQKAAGSTITNDFWGANCRFELRTGTATPAKDDVYDPDVVTPVTASRHTRDATYPKSPDDDTDNSATNLQRKVTWRCSWSAASFNATDVLGGCIHVGGDSPGAGTALLTHWDFGDSFSKSLTDTLKVLVNHDFLGA